MSLTRRSLTTLAIAGAALLAGCGQTATSPASASAPAAASSSRAATPTASASVPLADATSGSVHLSQGWVVATTGGTAKVTANPSASGTATPLAGEASGSASATPMGGMSGSAAPAGAMSAAYAVLENTGATDDALVSVTTSVAGMAQLHETTTGSGAGTMHEVSSIALPSHGSATLKPGGYHVMLMQLKQPLPAGSSVTMTWTFKSGATITTTFPVISRQDRPGA